MHLLISVVVAFFAVKFAADRFGVLAGFLAFLCVVVLSALAANHLGIDLSSPDCFDYGTRARGC